MRNAVRKKSLFLKTEAETHNHGIILQLFAQLPVWEAINASPAVFFIDQIRWCLANIFVCAACIITDVNCACCLKNVC